MSFRKQFKVSFESIKASAKKSQITERNFGSFLRNAKSKEKSKRFSIEPICKKNSSKIENSQQNKFRFKSSEKSNPKSENPASLNKLINEMMSFRDQLNNQKRNNPTQIPLKSDFKKQTFDIYKTKNSSDDNSNIISLSRKISLGKTRTIIKESTIVENESTDQVQDSTFPIIKDKFFIRLKSQPQKTETQRTAPLDSILLAQKKKKLENLQNLKAKKTETNLVSTSSFGTQFSKSNSIGGNLVFISSFKSRNERIHFKAQNMQMHSIHKKNTQLLNFQKKLNNCLFKDQYFFFVKTNRKMEVLRILEHSPETVKINDDLGNKALHYAVKRKFYGMSKLLICFGADVNAIDKQGKIALAYAFENQSEKIMKVN